MKNRGLISLSTLTLGEICDQGGGIIRTGPFGSQLHESDYSDTGTPVVMPKDIIEGKVSEASIARVFQEHVDRLALHRLLPGDIVYGRRGDIGRQALITERESGWLCGTGCLRITPGDAPVDSTWLHYYLREEKVIEFIAQQAVGATMPNLNTSILRSIPITFPDKTTQRRIASILSAYDDLIENNTRRIAILEEMARRIYEEWFVRFRFPGHEKVRMVESELGLVPEGWEIRSLGDIAAINAKSIRAGNAPRKILYIDIASVTPGVIEQKQPYSFDDAPGRARRVVAHGDVIWSCVRPNRRSYALVLNPEPALIASTGFAVLSAVEVPYSWLYFSVTNDAFVAYLTNHATGAAYPAVTAAVFESVPTLLPDSIVLQEFHAIIEPMLLLCESLKRKNANLRTTRDLLLPKLISGELDVSHLPEPEAMAA